MPNTLLRDLMEFVVPRPNMIIKDRKSGKYGKVDYFSWKQGETEKIPVTMEDGKTDSVYVSAFNYRYVPVDPDSHEYKEHHRKDALQREIKKLQGQFSQALSMAQTLQGNRKEMTSIAMKQALDMQIYDLQDFQNELLRKIGKLRAQL